LKQGSSHFDRVIVGINFLTLGITGYSFSVFFAALLKEFGWDRSTAAFSFFIIVHGKGLDINIIVDTVPTEVHRNIYHSGIGGTCQSESGCWTKLRDKHE
jgi:hypothetical protein